VRYREISAKKKAVLDGLLQVFHVKIERRPCVVGDSATAAVTTASAASTTTAATATAFLARPRFINGQGSAKMLLFVEPLNCRLGFGVAAHFHETKTLAASGFAILNHLGTFNGAILAEQLFQL
jgi:hypothetical protein